MGIRSAKFLRVPITGIRTMFFWNNSGLGEVVDHLGEAGIVQTKIKIAMGLNFRLTVGVEFFFGCGRITPLRFLTLRLYFNRLTSADKARKNGETYLSVVLHKCPWF